MSSLREDIKQVRSNNQSLASLLEPAAFDAIMLAIDSHIPEPSTYFKPEFITDSNRALNDAYLHGQEHFRDLMREELDV